MNAPAALAESNVKWLRFLREAKLRPNPNSQHFAPAHNSKMPLIVRMNAPRFRPPVANDVGDTEGLI